MGEFKMSLRQRIFMKILEFCLCEFNCEVEGEYLDEDGKMPSKVEIKFHY